MYVKVYPRRAIGWIGTTEAQSLISGEPLSRMTCQGSKCQAPESMQATALLGRRWSWGVAVAKTTSARRWWQDV
jgi:hypothetical protein